MSSTSNYEVHLGFWTNWSKGKVQGATVTLTRQNGGLLIAFLAIFVGMVGKSFWRLGCFALHRWFSSSSARDGLYHQRQAILRNSDTAQDGAWRLFWSLLAWRSGRRAPRPIIRLAPLIVFSLLVSAAFGVASIFSARVTTETANEVLLKGSNCGGVDFSKPHDISRLLTTLQPYRTDRSNRMLNYGLQCYTNSSNTDGCNLYVKSRLPLKLDRGISCPFGDNICKMETGNLALDTGYLDSLEHFGINAPPNERFQLRFVHKCAPIKTKEFIVDYDDPDYGPVARYMYGRRTNPLGYLNFTYELPKDYVYLPNDNASSAAIPRLDYSLGSINHRAGIALNDTQQSWWPIDPLQKADADTHLVFLGANHIHFSAPVHDPWFSATTNTTPINHTPSKQQFPGYLQDEPLGVLACTVQTQYCNPRLPKAERCEPLRGFSDVRKTDEVKKIFGTGHHFRVIDWADSTWASQRETISDFVDFIGASALFARYGLAYGYQAPLPDNHWQLEVEHFVKAMLTSVQNAWVTYADGYPLEDWRDVPAANDTFRKRMCRNQKIMSTQYSSFNVLGISLIMILGMLIIVLDAGLEPAVAWWQRRRHRTHALHDGRMLFAENGVEHPLYKVLEWSHTSMLQLQRLAHEEAGYGTWSACDGDTPVTLPNQMLGTLNLRDVKHPVLKTRIDTLWSPGSGLLGTPGIRRTDTGLETLVEEDMMPLDRLDTASMKKEPLSRIQSP